MSKVKKSIRKLLFRYRKATASLRKLPDFVIIGTQKGGTSSLYYYLSQHPQTQMSNPKEVHYYDINYKKGLAWYKSHFPYKWNKKITGEASPYYIFHPHAPKRIHKDLPQVKIIMLLRDPVERAFSHYKMNVKNGTETLSFEEAIDKENERLEDDISKMQSNELYAAQKHRLYSYVNRGLYSDQLKNWLQYFPLEQMMIIKSEDFFQNTEVIVKQVLDFLQLEESSNIKFINKNKGVPGKFKEETRNRLKTFYEKSVQNLSELSGKQISW